MTTDTPQGPTQPATQDTPTVHNIRPALLDRALPLQRLEPHPQNARRRDARAETELRRSLEVNGQYRSVVARELDNGRVQLLAGHGTVEQARALGWTHVAVEAHAGVSDEAAARIVLVDNRTSDLAEYDEAALAELLQSLPSLEGTGYDDAALAALTGGDAPVALTDADEAPTVPSAPHTRPGDVWLLGPHRVLCGDATDREVVAGFLAGAVPDAVWTDPPYGVEYVGKTAAALTIRNDGKAGLAKLLLGAFTTLTAVCRPGAPVYVAHADTERLVFEHAMLEAGLVVRQNLVWVKNSIVLGHSDYHYRHEPVLEGTVGTELVDPDEAVEPAGLRHEPVLYGFTPGGTGRLGRGGDRWYGDNAGSTVFEVDKPPRNAEHPTMKPVDLIVRMLENSLPPGGLVLDLFGGSGSTLIAAHRLGARAALVELDARYVDVICHRYQDHTGTVPVLERTGRPHDFAKAE